MKIKVINKTFAVCKVKDLSGIKFDDEYCFIGKTDEEISLVCEESSVPDNFTECSKSWSAFRIEGILEFSMVGVLSELSGILAEKTISIFAVSTFNTDYILVKKEDFQPALQTLKTHGYEIISAN